MAGNKTPLFVRRQPGGVFTVVDERQGTGNLWWVDSGSATKADSVGSGQNPEGPFATLDYAIGQCEANNGDIIYVMPGHAETLTSAGAIACDKAGISIIGLGVGADRPTLTFSSTDNSASVLITAASTKIKNIIGICGDDGLTNPFHVQAADCELDIEWHDGSSTVEAVSCIVGTDAADRIKINLKYIGFIAGDACVSPVLLDGSVQGRINVDFYGKASTAVVRFNDTAVEDIYVTGYFYNESAALTKNVVDTPGTSTWYVQGYDGKSGQSFSGGSSGAVAGDDISAVKVDTAAILIDTAVIGALGAGLTALSTQTSVDALLTAAGTEFSIKKAIIDKTTIITAGLLLTGVSSGGELILKRVTLQNDGTVTGGNTGGALIYTDDATYPLNIALTNAVFAVSGFVGVDIGYPLQTGKKVGIKAVTGACTGVGALVITMTFVRNANAATIAAV